MYTCTSYTVKLIIVDKFFCNFLIIEAAITDKNSNLIGFSQVFLGENNLNINSTSFCHSTDKS